MWETPTRYLDVTDARLPYWKFGEGPDLVFVHGWPLDARTWRHSIEALSTNYTCHVFDLPGAGLSQWDVKTLRIEAYANIVREVIEQLHLESFGLVGQNSGGSFARMAATYFPDQLRGMVLGNTEIPGHHPWRLTVLLPFVRATTLWGALKKVMSTRWGQRALFHDAVKNSELIQRDLARLYIQPLLEDTRRFEGAMLLVRSVEVEDFDKVGEAHPKITAPVHMIWGRQDPYFPWKHAQAMCSEFGGEVEMTILDNAKLLVHEELPQEFNRLARQHFDTCFA